MNIINFANDNYGHNSQLRKLCIEEYYLNSDTEEGYARWQRKWDKPTMIFNKDLFVKFMNEAGVHGRVHTNQNHQIKN